jgi:hypothetical protein
MSAAETKRFYDSVDPWVDTYTREANVPLPQLAEVASKIEAQVMATKGNLRYRLIDAPILLANQPGSQYQKERELVDSQMFALMKRIGPEPFLEPALAEMRSLDCESEKSTAARLVRRMDKDAVAQAREVLLRHLLEGKDGALAGTSYWALVCMGLEEEAKKAMATHVRLRGERGGK